MGYKSNQILIPEEGKILETDGVKTWIPPEKIEAKNVLVDGLGIGDVGNVVLRDRKTLATDGILIAIITSNGERLETSDVDIVSRGFIFMKENKDFVEELKKDIVDTSRHIEKLRDTNFLQRKVISHLEKHIYAETKRRPLVLVEVLEI